MLLTLSPNLLLIKYNTTVSYNSESHRFNEITKQVANDKVYLKKLSSAHLQIRKEYLLTKKEEKSSYIRGK